MAEEFDFASLYPSSMVRDPFAISQAEYEKDYPGLLNSVEEVDEDSEEDPQKEDPKPICFVLSREQTKKGVQQSILKAVQILIEKSDQINGTRVNVEGFDYTGIHPAQNKSAKKIFADAIEWGLAGFFFANGFKQQAREIYCIAHVRAQIKSGGKLKFKKIDNKHVDSTIAKSLKTYYLLLVESEQFSEEELYTLHTKKNGEGSLN